MSSRRVKRTRVSARPTRKRIKAGPRFRIGASIGREEKICERSWETGKEKIKRHGGEKAILASKDKNLLFKRGGGAGTQNCRDGAGVYRKVILKGGSSAALSSKNMGSKKGEKKGKKGNCNVDHDGGGRVRKEKEVLGACISKVVGDGTGSQGD